MGEKLVEEYALLYYRYSSLAEYAYTPAGFGSAKPTCSKKPSGGGRD